MTSLSSPSSRARRRRGTDSPADGSRGDGGCAYAVAAGGGGAYAGGGGE
jgi:hypothetical protein